MLTVIQFPYTDVRSFLQEPTHQLAVPTWDALNPAKDFIRSIGSIRVRRQGASEEWPTENAFCRVSRAIRFDPAYQTVPDPPLAALRLRRYCAFRRFVADGSSPGGSVGARMEFGFGVRSRSGRPLTPQEGVAYVRSALEIPVTFYGDGAPRKARLLDACDLFAGLYLRSTTKRTPGQAPAAVQPGWFRAGMPLAVVELSLPGALMDLPPGAKLVSALAHTGITLAYVSMEISRLPVGVWLIGVSPECKDPDLLRRVRISLLHLHAERQSINEVLRSVQLGKITVVKDTPPSESLQAYLATAMRRVKPQVRRGLPQSELLAASQEATDLVRVGEREQLLEKLKKIRGNLFRNVQTYLGNVASTAAPAVSKSHVFISYSHQDKKFLAQLMTHLKPLQLNGQVYAWSDEQIDAGSQWAQEIRTAVEAAKVAVMLVTKDFLASDFIHKQELGPFLKEAAGGSVSILWVLVGDCNWKYTPLKDFQAAYSTAKSLASMTKGRRDTAWVAICEKIIASFHAPQLPTLVIDDAVAKRDSLSG